MSENTAPARCTEAEWRAARAAGLPFVTTYDEVSIHQFAEAIRAEERAAAQGLLAALRRTEDNLSRLIAAAHHDEVLMTPWRDDVRAAIAKATGSAA